VIPLILATICTLPQEAGVIVRDECETLEINWHHDCCGNLVFRQLIAWDWEVDAGQVVAWRILKAVQIERRGEFWFATWQDGNALRCVRARYFKETWTPACYGDGDPELAQRAIRPQSQRRGLTCAPQERR
jgi:hypothetical protein